MDEPEIEEDFVRYAAATWTVPMPHEPCIAGTFYAEHSWSERKARQPDFDAADAAEWILLMQFPKWNEYGGTNFGGPGGGMLEFWIKHTDLRTRRFDRVWIQVDAV